MPTRKVCGTCGTNGYSRFACPLQYLEKRIFREEAAERMKRIIKEKRAWSSGDREDPDEGPSQPNSKRLRSELPIPMNPIHIRSDTESDTISEDTTRYKTSSKTKVQWRNPWKASSPQQPQQPHKTETLAQVWKTYTSPTERTTCGDGYHMEIIPEDYFTKRLYDDIQQAPTLPQPGSGPKPILKPQQRISADQVVPTLKVILKSAATTTRLQSK